MNEGRRRGSCSEPMCCDGVGDICVRLCVSLMWWQQQMALLWLSMWLQWEVMVSTVFPAVVIL